MRRTTPDEEPDHEARSVRTSDPKAGEEALGRVLNALACAADAQRADGLSGPALLRFAMAAHYLTERVTPEVRAAQAHYYGRAQANPGESAPDALGPDELAFIATRDSFYLGTVSPTGFPYIQHRGGAAGFLRTLSPSTLAFADYKGNRQLLSTGHLAASDEVSLFLMDYPQRVRLELLGHAEVLDARSEPVLLDELTPRYTADEVRSAMQPLQQRIAELEAQLAAARA